MLTEVGFSWDLRLNGGSIGAPFGNMRFSQTVNGFGESGMSISSFEVDVYDSYGTYGEALLEQATLQLVEVNDYCLPSKKYYIAKRSISKNVCHFVAYDVLSLAEQTFDVSAVTGYEVTEIPCGNVLEAIKNQCGFTSIGASGGGLNSIVFKPEQLENRSCADLLEMVSVAMCGTWIATLDNGAVLFCLGEPYDSSGASVDAVNWSEIDLQGRQKITGIVFTNSDTGTQNVLETGEYGVILTIDSPFVACGTALDALVWERVQDYVYQAWNCEKALIDGLAVSCACIGFDGVEWLVNSVSLDVDSTGIYFSGGLPPQDESQWQYEERLERVKIGIDKPVGNTTIDNEGKIVYRNLNNGKESNLDEHDNGICYYRSDN